MDNNGEIYQVDHALQLLNNLRLVQFTITEIFFSIFVQPVSYYVPRIFCFVTCNGFLVSASSRELWPSEVRSYSSLELKKK